MNTCKFYKRDKNGTVTVLRIEVTQSHAAILARDNRKLRLNGHLPTVREARRIALNKGFTAARDVKRVPGRGRRSDRMLPEAA